MNKVWVCARERTGHHPSGAMRLLGVPLLLLLFLNFPCAAAAQQSTGHEEHHTGAFARPEQQAVDQAVRQMLVIFAIAGAGGLALIIGLWYWYTPVVVWIGLKKQDKPGSKDGTKASSSGGRSDSADEDNGGPDKVWTID